MMEVATIAAFAAGGVLLGFALGRLTSVASTEEKTVMSVTLQIDATRKVQIKNPVVKITDSEGSPKRSGPVENFGVTLADVVGHAGEISALADGSFEFNPGDEIAEQASGTLVYTGTFEGKPIPETRQPFELNPGAEDVVSEIVPEIVVEEPPQA